MRSRWLDGLVFWTPRLVCIAFAAFLCVFALDVFDMPLPPLQKFAAFVIHLVPAAIVAAGLIVVWSHEWVGAAFFTADAGRLRDIWVLGDLVNLRAQLGEPSDGEDLSG